MKIEINGQVYEGRELKSWVVKSKSGRGFTVHLYEVQLPDGGVKKVKKIDKL
ncbi:MAG: hypothetical protein ACP5NY_04055 [Thermocladium sp.]